MLDEYAASELLPHRSQHVQVEVGKPQLIRKDIRAVEVRVDGVSKLLGRQTIESLQPSILGKNIIR
jgi:hypothetical protein